jgi:hypothetical protein
MDKQEFRRRLEEIAVIKDKKPARTPSQPRWAKEIVTEIDELTGEEIEVEREITDNPTLGLELIKIRDRTQACELGCPDTVTNQVIERRFCTSPRPHWRTRCQNCGCYVSPDGIGFVDGSHAINAVYIKYFNNLPKKDQDL